MKRKILLIDDDRLVINTLARLLKATGYEITAAENGQQALDQIVAETFDLIISDIRMPGTDGVQLVKKIEESLKIAGRAAIPYIFITGYADGEAHELAIQMKGREILYKPFDKEPFLQAIKTAIEG